MQEQTLQIPAQISVLSPHQYIRSEVENRLLFLGQLISDAQFEIGDITVDVISTIEELSKTREGIIVRQMEIYAYIASLTGKSARSIRKYATVAKFYGPETREKYSVLSFEHFFIALSYGDKWQALLDACLNQMDRDPVSKRPSADWINAYASSNYMTDYEAELMLQPVCEPVTVSLDEFAEELQSEDIHGISMSKAATRRILGMLNNIFINLEKVADIIPISTELHEKFVSVLDQLSSILVEIKEQVDVKDA